jgi:hypothetical protein
VRRPARPLWGASLALGLALAGTASAAEPGQGAPASPAARSLADWVAATRDAQGRAFVVVDKVSGEVFAFAPDGALLAAAPALVGAGRGDVSPPGIGERKLSTITPAERITPAGRFVARLGRNLAGEDIVWVDYGAAISLHRVVTHVRAERRLERLATPTPLDNRISYGCINVPKAFYEAVVAPIFKAGPAIVYVLPETRPVAEVFFPATRRADNAPDPARGAPAVRN